MSPRAIRSQIEADMCRLSTLSQFARFVSHKLDYESPRWRSQSVCIFAGVLHLLHRICDCEPCCEFFPHLTKSHSAASVPGINSGELSSQRESHGCCFVCFVNTSLPVLIKVRAWTSYTYLVFWYMYDTHRHRRCLFNRLSPRIIKTWLHVFPSRVLQYRYTSPVRSKYRSS